MFKRKLIVKIIVAIFVVISIPATWYGILFFETGVIKVDKEHVRNGTVLNPSTQSINRYSSVARELKDVKVDINKEKLLLSLTMSNKDNTRQVYAKDLDMRYLVPLLPYTHKQEPDDFDLANLMLAEYARNGIALSYQEKNSVFGVFNASKNTFSSNKEYLMKNGMVLPNKDVKPVRFGVTNNCLKPGLWEVNAKDTVGEMYHGWFNFPKDTYYEILRTVNGIEISDWNLGWALRYRKDLGDVEVKLDRLRKSGVALIKAKATLNGEKIVGGYSTQDSRRKSQKGYFTIIRDDKKIQPKTFSQMKLGDKFEMHKFISPGVYSAEDKQTVLYDPDWKNIVIRKVTPLTHYPDSKSTIDEAGYIELELKKDDESQAIILGNIPISLLVFQDDYKIPAYGVGVLPSSELIERRYFRLKEGPLPHYAYQVSKNKDNKWMLKNNHETGLEQIYLRPFDKNGRMYLRITLVSYERIVDLLEMVVEVDGELEKAIRVSSKKYSPPMFRVYKDANII